MQTLLVDNFLNARIKRRSQNIVGSSTFELKISTSRAPKPVVGNNVVQPFHPAAGGGR
ncbi:MAG: hypothetical protein R3C60_14230 [Parvularculaceae bacterium]